MTDVIIMKTKKYEDEEIYPGESIIFKITRENDAGDAIVFDDTATMTIEIKDNMKKEIDTMNVDLSADKFSFPVEYINTANWESGKTYHLLGRMKDSASSYNNVVVDITLKIQ